LVEHSVTTLPTAVELVEVGPRDGLQSERRALGTDVKVELVRRLVAAGARRVEVVSFAHPRLVPQMSDAEAVLRELGPSPDGVSFIGLVMNQRGLERALETTVDEVNFVVAAADGYSRANQGVGREEAMEEVERMASEAQAAGRPTTLTISVAFGDPYDGEVPEAQVVALAKRAVDAGIDEIALGDTIGVAVPTTVSARIEALREGLAGVPLRCHFHDTRRSGLANVFAAVTSGVTVLDTSVGGLGGSPFAPRAGGNVATEDAIPFLARMGIATHRDLPETIAIGEWLGAELGRDLPAAHQYVEPWP
jgi:hydroxymethylglutaryl-CoA lyase